MKLTSKVVTHNDEGFSKRVDRLQMYLMYGQQPPQNSNPYEVVAAKLLLNWELEINAFSV